MNLLAVFIVAVSIISPKSGDQCFNKTYPAPVYAEDHSLITCPAVYYAPEPTIESGREFTRYASN